MNPTPRSRHLFCFTMLLCGAFSVAHPARARSQRIRFHASVEIPDEGIRLPVPRGAEAVGLAPPEIHRYQDKQGQLHEMYDPRDFWYPNQFRGQWKDENGTTLTLAVPESILPRNWPRAHVTLDEYAKATAHPTEPQTDAELAAWAEIFSDAPLQGSVEESQCPPRLSRVRLFRFEGNEPRRLGIAFSFQKNPFRVDPNQWFFVLMEFEAPVDMDKIEQNLSRTFLAGIVPFQPRAVSSSAPSQFQHAPAQTQNNPRSRQFHVSRQRAINSIRGLTDWWHVETPKYVLVSDLPSGRAFIVRRIQADIEPLRAAFETLIPPRRPIEMVSVIRIFSDGSDYVSFVGADHEWSGGLWSSQLGELVIRPREWGSARDQEDWLLGTVYHESFHQYLYYALQGQRTGVWFNEGHATFFEGAEIKGNRIRISEPSRYAHLVDRLVSNNSLHFEQLFSLSYEAFYARGGNEEERANNYARAWGIIYFLRKFADPNAPIDGAGFLTRYVSALTRSSDLAQALSEALDGRTPQELEEAFTAFWTSPRVRRTALRFDPLQSTP